MQKIAGDVILNSRAWQFPEGSSLTSYFHRWYKNHIIVVPKQRS